MGPSASCQYFDPRISVLDNLLQEMYKPKILISVLNWNKANETLVCLDSLIDEVKSAHAEVTILVLDNASNPEDLSKLYAGTGHLPVVIQALPENTGFTGGHNVAIMKAMNEQFEFIWLVNNDAAAAPGTLNLLIQEMAGNPRCGAASPVIVNDRAGTIMEACIGTYDWASRKLTRASSLTEGKRIQAESTSNSWLSGTAIFFRVAALGEVGMLEARMFAYYDDVDICARLTSAGWTSRCVFSASVFHEPKGKIDQLPLYCFYLTQRNDMLFWSKNTPSKLRRYLWLKILDTALFDVNLIYQGGHKAAGDAALLGVVDYYARNFRAPDLNRKVPAMFRALCKASGFLYRKKLSSQA